MAHEIDSITHVVTLNTTLAQRYIDRLTAKGSPCQGDGGYGSPYFSSHAEDHLVTVVQVDCEDLLESVNVALEHQFYALADAGIPFDYILDPFEVTVAATHLIWNHWEGVLTADDDDGGLLTEAGAA